MLQTNLIRLQLLPSEKKQVRDAMTLLMIRASFTNNEQDLNTYIDGMEQVHEMYPEVFGSN